MGNLTNEENWAARERLRWVEFLLWWRGWVGRADLTDLFGISAAQASGDLQRYAGLNPSAMLYHTSRKRYEAVAEMACVLHVPVFEEAVRVLLGGGGGVAAAGTDAADGRMAVARLPARTLDVAIARRVMVALLEKRRLRVRYWSVNSGEAKWRALALWALAWDGQRWHVRAWCFSREAWQDFVPGRMESAEWPVQAAGELPPDEDWEAVEVLRLRVNPKLSEARRAALRRDYGLAGEVLEMPVRRAMMPYVLAAMFIDHASHRELPRHFVLEEG